MSQEEKNEDSFAKMIKPLIEQMSKLVKGLHNSTQPIIEQMSKLPDSVQPIIDQQRKMVEMMEPLMESLREWYKRFAQEWPGNKDD